MTLLFLPSYAGWIEISGDKLLLTGGEKDFIESLSSTYLFKFSVYSTHQDGFQAKVSKNILVEKTKNLPRIP